MSKRKPGRPALDPLERRTVQVVLRCTLAERDALFEAADAEGASLADVLRDLGMEWARKNLRKRSKIAPAKEA